LLEGTHRCKRNGASSKLEKENHDLRNQLNNDSCKNGAIRQKKTAVEHVKHLTRARNQQLSPSAEIADDKRRGVLNEHVEVFAEF
jgi:ribosomal protein S4